MATTARPARAKQFDELRSVIEAARREHRTAQNLVLNAAREAILTNVFEPGARLRQEELAAVFGISRIPVREARRALECEGLVRSEPHRGFTVTSLDADDVDEVYELRVLLEGEAVRLAIPGRSRGQRLSRRRAGERSYEPCGVAEEFDSLPRFTHVIAPKPAPPPSGFHATVDAVTGVLDTPTAKCRRIVCLFQFDNGATVSTMRGNVSKMRMGSCSRRPG